MLSSHRSARPLAVVVASVAALVLVGCQPLPTPLPGPGGGCQVRWGSQPELEPGLEAAAPVVDVRSGRHGCFDRLVIDLDGPPGAGWDVRYSERLRTPGQGAPVAVRGGAELRVVVRAPAYTPVRQQTYDPANPAEAVDVTGYRTLRQVAYLGSFEGRTSFGVGVRARLPFRVFALDGPGGGSRIVVDVAHAWR